MGSAGYVASVEKTTRAPRVRQKLRSEMSEMMKRNCSDKKWHKHGGLSTTQEVLDQMAHPKPARPLTKFALSPIKIVIEP